LNRKDSATPASFLITLANENELKTDNRQMNYHVRIREPMSNPQLHYGGLAVQFAAEKNSHAVNGIL